MRKQYIPTESGFGRMDVSVYHDGVLVFHKIMWLDEAQDAIDMLEDIGYTRAFTSEEIQKVKKQYDYMVANHIYKDGKDEKIC